MGCANEMVQQGKFDFICVSFLIAGHTKFVPDILFSKVAHTFSRSDTFTTTELAEIAMKYAYVVIDEGDRVFQVETITSQVFSTPWDTQPARFSICASSRIRCEVKVCYSGSIHKCQFHVKKGYMYTLAESAIPMTSMRYRNTGQVHLINFTVLQPCMYMYSTSH